MLQKYEKRCLTTLFSFLLTIGLIILPAGATKLPVIAPEVANAYFTILDRLCEKNGLYLLSTGPDTRSAHYVITTAQLIDFDANGVPELFFIHVPYAPYDWEDSKFRKSTYEIWGWNGSEAYPVCQGQIQDSFPERETFVPDLDSLYYEDGQYYLIFYRVLGSDSTEGSGQYLFYTIKNGAWVEETEKRMSWNFTPIDAERKCRIGAKDVSMDTLVRRDAHIQQEKIIFWDDKKLHYSEWLDDMVKLVDTLNAPISLTSQPKSIQINGKSTSLEFYLIGGNNYVKLRDIAAAMGTTSKAFDVQYSGTPIIVERSVYAGDTLETAVSHTAIGRRALMNVFVISPQQYKAYQRGELQLDPFVYRANPEPTPFQTLLISNQNYVKLRDLGQALDFAVGWDVATSTIIIDTSTGYAAE